LEGEEILFIRALAVKGAAISVIIPSISILTAEVLKISSWLVPRIKKRSAMKKFRIVSVHIKNMFAAIKSV
jgi:hypothetical protein